MKEIINYMETITLNSRVGQDGILHLDIPVNMVNADLTINISVCLDLLLLY